MHWWTEKELVWLRKHVKGTGSAELTDMFNRRFGLDIKVSQMLGTMERYGLRNGIKTFSLGCVPHNKGEVKIGTEKLRHGYTIVKTADPVKGKAIWKRKHVLIWEKAHGPVPKNHCIVFADGNNQNFSLKNLIMVSRPELFLMNKKGLISPNAELTKTGKLVADVLIKIAERKHKSTKRKKEKGL